MKETKEKELCRRVLALIDAIPNEFKGSGADLIEALSALEPELRAVTYANRASINKARAAIAKAVPRKCPVFCCGSTVKHDHRDKWGNVTLSFDPAAKAETEIEKWSVRVSEVDDENNVGLRCFEWRIREGNQGGYCRSLEEAICDASLCVKEQRADKTRSECRGFFQYLAKVQVDGGEMEGDSMGSAFSDWFATDLDAVVGFWQIMEEQGYAVDSVEIGPVSVVRVTTNMRGRRSWALTLPRKGEMSR